MAGRAALVAASGEHGLDTRVTTDAALATLPAEWTVLHDVAWPSRRRAVIDHVVVGPSGVFVLTTQSWSGQVVVEDGLLHHQGRNQINALRSVVAAAAAVASLWPHTPPAPVHALLCVTGPPACRCCPGGSTAPPGRAPASWRWRPCSPTSRERPSELHPPVDSRGWPGWSTTAPPTRTADSSRC